ncbi:hypothetical protein KAK07_17495 [Ideonella sp. 4Y16]|uniref:hypothetical protein n=1 Tax=Ideonella alba TaxID=2824118 RepID=UPI001B38F996|nr:hypothetical protein [Ideonella alba]MBQ0945136.1 hypothetical protein [Ideonella alba]
MNRCTPLLALTFFLPAVNAAEEPFKALCVAEKSTGFNWKSGQWVQANFKAERKLIVQKLDLDKYRTKPAHERPLACSDDAMNSYDSKVLSKGCYLIKEMGSPTFIMFDSEVCIEAQVGDRLQSVQCKKLTFNPDGAFIEYPWHSDISPKPKDDYKDSLIVSVGTCSRLSD